MFPISVTLSSNIDSLWHSCFELEHEMIIDINGRRIFPAMEYNVTNLDPNKMYSMRFHLDCVDDKKMRFVNGTWVESRSTETKDPPRKVWHHEGPQTGKTWMARSISFDQIRITKRKSKEDENPFNVHLHIPHRYIPVLAIYEGDELVYTARIAHTQFITVPYYHKPGIHILKTDNNKYSKAFRKDRRCDRQQNFSSDNLSSENSKFSPPSKKMKKEILAPLKTIKEEDLSTQLLQFFTPPGQTLLLPQFSPERAPCLPLSVKKEDLPTVNIPIPNVLYSAPDFKTLQALFLSQCAAQNIPGPPSNIPTPNISFPTRDFQILQSVLTPQFVHSLNPFFNPFLNPIFTPLFPTPAVSPFESGISETNNKTDTTDEIIDIV